MSLTNLKGILGDADTRRYAVGAFNITGLDTLESILAAAEEKRSPVILNIAEVHFPYVDLETISPVALRLAESAKVPVVLHLDHGMTFEAVIRALRCGFTSVMFDGSSLPYNENLERTKDIVRICKSAGVSVEAELGHVGGAEGGENGDQSNKALFTDPEQALSFVSETGIDALAVAIGSAHGLYKAAPKLDFERLTEIKARVGMPLVLHGGSGIPDDDFRKAISLGITKINFFSEMAQRACQRIKAAIEKKPDFWNYPDLIREAKAAMKDTVAERMDVFGSSGACNG